MTADELAKCGEDLLTATITNQSWARKYGSQLLAAAERCGELERENARLKEENDALNIIEDEEQAAHGETLEMWKSAQADAASWRACAERLAEEVEERQRYKHHDHFGFYGDCAVCRQALDRDLAEYRRLAGKEPT